MSGPCVDDMVEDKDALVRGETGRGTDSSFCRNCREELMEKREGNTDNWEPKVEPGTILVGASGVEEVFANDLARITLVQ